MDFLVARNWMWFESVRNHTFEDRTPHCAYNDSGHFGGHTSAILPNSCLEWLPIASGNGAFVLINRATGLLVHGSTEWTGAKVDQLAPTGDSTEQWIVVPVM
jgi:hypothetical protein